MDVKKIVIGILLILILFVIFANLLANRYDMLVYMPGFFGGLTSKIK